MSDRSARRGKRLFILGHARSGTTIVQTAANLDPACLILREADVHIYGDVPSFREFFNARREHHNLAPAKGNFLPAFLSSHGTAEDCFQALAAHYAFVGDKIALGPGRPEQGTLLDYFSRNYFTESYVLTIREPSEALASMAKMFPRATFNEILSLWFYSAGMMLSFQSVFPSAQMILHHRITDEAVVDLLSGIGLSVDVPAGTIGRVHQKSEPYSGEHSRELLRVAQDLFATIESSWDRANFRVQPITLLGDKSQERWRDIDELLRELNSPLQLVRQPEPDVLLRHALRARVEQHIGIADFSTVAIADGEALLRVAPNDAFANYALGFSYAHVPNKRAQAMALLDEAERAGFDPFWISYSRAQVCLKLGLLEGARTALDKATRINPGAAGLAEVRSWIDAAGQKSRTV